MENNIIIIVLDALRLDRIGAFDGRGLTPNIDDFASESTIFTNAYSTTNVTDVAVTSIQTGRHPLSHGVINHGTYVTDQEKNTVEKITQLPEVLLESGYQTAKFGRPLGRWHRRGFQVYPESMEDSVAQDRLDPEDKNAKQRLGNKLEYIHPKLRSTAGKLYRAMNFNSRSNEINTVPKYNKKNDDVVRNFSDFIQDSEQFYAFIHLMDTHARYTANPNRVKSYLNKFNYDVDAMMPEIRCHPDSFDQLVDAGEYPEIENQYYLPGGTPTTAVTDAHYDAAVTRSDERVGNILSSMKEADIYDDSLIILLSDHGESLTEHGIYYDHHGLYDVSVHIPLIIRPPGGTDKKITELVQITDIAPTIEEYTGTHKLDTDGYSLRPVIEADEESIKRSYAMAEEAHTQRRRMIRSENSKLIYSLNGDTICRYCDIQHAPELEYYNLEKDPNENENIAKECGSDIPDLKKCMEKKTKQLKKRRPDTNNKTGVTYDDEEEVKDRLEALGYR